MKKETAKKLTANICTWLDQYADKGITSPKDMEFIHCALGCLWKIFEIEHSEKIVGCELCDEDETTGQTTGKVDIKAKLNDLIEEAEPEDKEMLKKFMRIL